VSYEPHPYADIFPLHEGQPLWEMAADIKEHGLRERVVLYQDKVLDGRRRLLACFRAKVEPEFTVFKGTDLQALALVISKNLHRRHLGESERAMVAAKIATLKDGERKTGAPIGAPQEGSQRYANLEEKTQTEAAELLNVSRNSVQRARQVIKHGDPELQQAVERGEVSVSDAARITGKPSAVQREAVAKVRSGKAKTVSKAVSEADIPATGLIDGLKQPVPKRLEDVFVYVPLFSEVAQHLHAASRKFEEICRGPAGHEIKKEFRTVENNMEQFRKWLRFYMPYTACPLCNGANENCKACHGHGWVNKATFNQPGIGKEAR
jgi:ParB-like chromosome segregation protein Spo0J